MERPRESGAFFALFAPYKHLAKCHIVGTLPATTTLMSKVA